MRYDVPHSVTVGVQRKVEVLNDAIIPVRYDVTLQVSVGIGEEAVTAQVRRQVSVEALNDVSVRQVTMCDVEARLYSSPLCPRRIAFIQFASVH